MLRIALDADALLKDLAEKQLKQVPFAMSQALNRTSEDAQKAEQSRIKAQFKLNSGRAGWVLKGVYRSNADKATKTKWTVILQLQQQRDFLEKFEERGIHEPMGGRQFLWIPNSKVFKNGIVPQGSPLRPSKIKFTKSEFKGGYQGMQGGDRTFMIKRADGGLLVMQRIASGKQYTAKSMARLNLNNVATGLGPHRKRQSAKLKREQGTRMLYTLKERVTVPVKLQFIDTIKGKATEVFKARFDEALGNAMRTAR